MQNKFGRRSFFGRVFSAAAGVSLLKISKPAAALARAIPPESSENLRSEESDTGTDTMISGREITGNYTIPPESPEWAHHAVFYQVYPQSFYDSNGD